MTTTKPNMHAVAINPATWPRQTYFYYFTKIAPSGFKYGYYRHPSLDQSPPR